MYMLLLGTSKKPCIVIILCRALFCPVRCVLLVDSNIIYIYMLSRYTGENLKKSAVKNSTLLKLSSFI